MYELKLKIAGMTCINCQNNIEKTIKALPGVKDASVSFINQSGFFLLNSKSDERAVCEKIKELGFKILASEQEILEFKQKALKLMLLKLVLALLSTLAIFLVERFMVLNQSVLIQLVLAAFSVFILGFSFHKKCIYGLKNRLLDMNTLISLGSFFSFFYSCLHFFLDTPLYFMSSSMIVAFVLFGKVLEENARLKASLYMMSTKASKKEFINLILSDGSTKGVLPAFIKEKDIFLLKKGEALCVDARLKKGEASFNLSVISGESKPMYAKEGSVLKAGAILLDNSCEFEALCNGADSSLETLDNIIFKASSKEIKLSSLVDKISARFVLAILILSLTSFFYWLFTSSIQEAFLHALAVLLISCPCALGMAVPLALSIGLKKALENDILVKDPFALEELCKSKNFCFDKTGTLTKALEIDHMDIKPKDLAILKAMQVNCKHQIAAAVLKLQAPDLGSKLKVYYEENGLKSFFEDELYYAGNEQLLKDNNISLQASHLEFKGNSKIYFANSKQSLGVLSFEPTLQTGTKDLVSFLKAKHKRLCILSGDDEASVKSLANLLGIKEYKAGLLPKEKEDIIKSSPCVFVGDGVNDALALSAARLSIVIENASYISKKAGDILLLKQDLKSIIYLLRLSKASFRVIYINLFASFVYNACLIPVAMGLTPFSISPAFAAFAMCLSSLSVVLNSLRLRFFK